MLLGGLIQRTLFDHHYASPADLAAAVRTGSAKWAVVGWQRLHDGSGQISGRGGRILKRFWTAKRFQGNLARQRGEGRIDGERDARCWRQSQYPVGLPARSLFRLGADLGPAQSYGLILRQKLEL
jgi:hypothetical protein